MDSFVSENVAAEKVVAMKRFERRRKFWKFLPVIEALVAVLLILSLFTSSLSAGEYLRRLISGGLTGGIFIIFGVVNVLIALIFSLSNHQKKKLMIEPDLYFQYVSSSAAAPVAAVVSKPSASENAEKTSEVKPKTTDSLSSVTLENKETILTAGEARMVRREMVRAVSSVAETADRAIRRKREMTFLPATMTHDDHHIYRRSRSERLNLRGDLGRSMRRLCEMDDLSNDEFRSTVETFIAGKKKMLLKEWMKP
ncbi:hypothetical protein EUTSA_v10008556mg [Eutrema salsugineum]|uniref:DUF4408 domain-containing protein n=1 Tax=Eutrema salsugineum TaxID=72664 RepID=V4K8Z0_EUTSA|nr:uncharacterized protein LOC18992299 [Eutrema salsugineum]ESQ34095.1 hypothetical protein EUTSA_v10008556mg [Eutrema salsugineum]